MTIYDFSQLGFATGEVAVVTGAANGIGRSTALMLGRSGVTVAGWDLAQEKQALDEVVAEINSGGGTAIGVTADLTNQEQIDAAWDETGSLGAVQYLVNNAGPASTTPISVADGVSRSIGSYAAVTEAWLARHASTASSVTYTASIAGNYMVGPTQDWYPAAKAGITGYMRHNAVKFGGRPRANGVAPGGTVTRRTAEAFASPAMQEQLKKHPMGRAAESDEVASVICFLLSPAASFVNGVLIAVDGAVVWTTA